MVGMLVFLREVETDVKQPKMYLHIYVVLLYRVAHVKTSLILLSLSFFILEIK